MYLTSNILNDIEQRLCRVREKQSNVDLYSNVLILITGILIVVLVIITVEALFEFSRTARTIISISFITTLVLTFSWLIILPSLRFYGWFANNSDEDVAKQIGLFFPDINDRLLNALQLAKNISNDESIYSIELIQESLKEFAGEIKSIDFTECINTSHIPNRLKLLMFTSIVIILAVISFPASFSSSAFRLIHFNREYASLPKYSIEIIPGNKEIVKNENVNVQIKLTSLVPTLSKATNEVTIIRQQDGQENFDELKLLPDSSGNYFTTFQTIRSTTTYYAKYADVESEHYKITVLDLPIIRSFRVRLDYPDYSKIPQRVLDDFIGDVTALAGTRVTITGISSKSLLHGSIYFNDNKNIPLNTRGDIFSASFILFANGNYSVSITDSEELSNREPILFQLKVIMDDYPVIAIIEPGRNIDIAGDKSLFLRLQAKDDFGFSNMRLGYRLIKSRYEKSQLDYTYTQILFTANAGGQIEIPFTWNLVPLNLVPEDVVEYFAEVFDNDVFKGPKSGRSNIYLLRLPSLDEVFADVDREHDKTIEDIKQSLEQAKKLKEDIESINRDLKKNKNPDWQTQKKMEEMEKKYQQVQKKMDEVQDRLEQMTQQMQQQNILSKETMEKYLELQQLFQQINTAELQKMLKQMQKMPSISKEQLQQAMQKITFSEEQFRQSIERTLNLLKRIQIEQKMDEVKKRAQELESLENEIKDETSKLSNDTQKQQELARRQSDLKKKQQAMEREAADLQRRMEEYFTEMPADKLQKLLEQMQQQQLDQKMQQAAQQLQMGNMQSAQQMQQQISQQLQQFSKQMDTMQQQMLQQQAQFVINELRKASNNMLELSKEEEALKQQSQNAPPNSPQLRQNAQDQLRVIQDLNNVIKGLGELSQKSFAVTPEMGKAIGEAQARMNNAMRNLDGRNGSQASQEQGQAMAALNRAAMQVQNALQQMMQGGGSGAGSLMQQLQMMAGQQMTINMQTQQMGGMSQQQASEAARLAKEQGAIQKSLEELNHEAQTSNEQQKLLGDIQKIADEMKEVVKSLEQNNVNPETIKKQERILSRLLDASKSMRERDYEKKRKAETGTQITRSTPKDLDLNSLERRNQLQEELLKALEHGYSKDYQELIRRYFEELEKTEKSLY